jgi:lysophospholipase L1-like esterase
VLLGAVTALVVAEAALRVLGPSRAVSQPRGLYEFRPDRKWLYGLRPGAEGTVERMGNVHYRANADGFRDRVYARPKPPGVFRVVVLGDSIAFGFGVDEQETFPKVLEALAEGASEQRVEVVNLGVSGYNAYTEAALLADVGVTYEPDLILVQFCVNDLNDPTLHFDRHTLMHMGAIPDEAYPDPSLRRAPQAAPSWSLLACRSSRVCSAFDDLLLAWRSSSAEDAEMQAALAPVDGRPGPVWHWLEARYLEMAATAETAGADFAVLAFPYRGQLRGNAPHPVQQRLLELADRNGWVLVDPLAEFRESSRAGEELLFDLWHPTPAGQRVAAQKALEELSCRGLMPRDQTVSCPEDPPATPAGAGADGSRRGSEPVE